MSGTTLSAESAWACRAELFITGAVYGGQARHRFLAKGRGKGGGFGISPPHLPLRDPLRELELFRRWLLSLWLVRREKGGRS